MISAGIAWGIAEEGYGVVAEAYGNMDENALKETLEKRILEMANIRGIKLRKIKYKIETLDVPEGNYGCAVAALVYLF